MEKLLLSFLAFLMSFSVFALNMFSNIDKSLDSLDPVAPYGRLQSVVKESFGPNEFTADGCSGEISETWNNYIYPRYIQPKLDADNQRHIPFPVEYCCLEHDKSYHRGFFTPMKNLSQEELRAQRKKADMAFRACIANPINKDKFINTLAIACLDKDASESEIRAKKKKLSKKINVSKIADYMYFGVRFGGRPCSNHEYRFGYGYDNCEDHGTSTLNTSFKVVLDIIESFY